MPALLAHLPEVQNRREMVDALGAIGDPAACDALVESLRNDSYVPVRAQAAKSLAKLGDPSKRPTADRVSGAPRRSPPASSRPPRHDTEPMVIAAARQAADALGAR